MDIIGRIKKIEKEFDELKQKIKKEQKEFEQIKQQKQKTVNKLLSEQDKLRGERRLLIEMGEEEGILETDEEGRIIPQEDKE
mgnify:CR=1 FL=1